MTGPETRNFSVEGMTCDHCRLSVEEEVSEIAGVDEVDVELDSGRLRVRGTGFTDSEIEAAVAEAGYAVKGT
jgi:copper chaperone